ncbi:MAG: discoidin domain-containing protein [Candidatus Poribacteria bacterium]
MNLRIIILIGSLGLLGFLFYPRSEKAQITAEQNWIQNIKKIDNEPLHYPITGKSNPKVSTYDLQFIYNLDKADLTFENPSEQGPRQYDILVSTRLDKRFNRAFSYTANSIEYTYSVQHFPLPLEGRWVQVAVNDWFSAEPNLIDFKIGAQYKRPGPIVSETANCNKIELYKLTDGIISSASKWVGARRIETESKDESGARKMEVEYKAVDVVVVTVDLGALKRIYGARVTTDGPSNNVKRYSVLLSNDGQRYNRVYTSDELEDKTISSLYLFERGTDSVSARYVQLRIEKGDWYGDYPEMREFEVFTDEYRLPYEPEKDINDYNAMQIYYDNCGEENSSSPNLVQGFPFDRGPKIPPSERYYLKEGDEVEEGNTSNQRSFAYHYDTIIFAYDSLDPQALYWVQATYLQPKNGNRIQNLLADGFILHGSEYPISHLVSNSDEISQVRSEAMNRRLEQDEYPLGLGKAGTFLFSIPSEAYSDGRLELHFNRLSGPNAVVSEVGLFEAYPRPKSVTAVAKEPAIATEVSVPIIIDGELDEWPTLYPILPEGYSGEKETPIRAYLQWDRDNLYLGVEVDRIALATTDGQISNDVLKSPDTLEIFVDAALNKHPRMYTYGDHHFIFDLLGSEKLTKRIKVVQQHHHLDAIPATIPDRKEIEFSYLSEADNKRYVLEARIPKGEVLQKFEPELGRLIGFNYILRNRFAQNIFWASEDTNAAPREWGEVELVGKVNGDIVIWNETATQTIEDFNAGDIITIGVIDSDRNTDRHAPQTVNVEVTGDLTKDKRLLTLYETTLEQLLSGAAPSDAVNVPNGQIFAVKLKTEYGVALPSQTGEGAKFSDKSMDVRLQSGEMETPFVVQGKERVTITYTDPYYIDVEQPDSVVRQISRVLTVNTGATGTLVILSATGERISEFNAGDTLFFEVIDGDLINAAAPASQEEKERQPPITDDQSPITNNQIEITVAVAQTGESERVILTSQNKHALEQSEGTEIPPAPFSKGGEEIYRGSIETAYSEQPKPEDGVLQIAGTQLVQAQYIDEIQDTGRTNARVIAEARVKVGYTAKITLNPLKTLRVKSGKRYFSAGDTIDVLMTDADLNQDARRQEYSEIVIVSDTLQDRLSVKLQEKSPNSGEFVGSFTTQFATAADTDDDILQVTGKEAVTATYIDALQGSGATNITVADALTVNTGENGALSIVKSNYITDVKSFNAGDTLYFRLRDADEESPYIQITVTGKKIGDTLKVPLTLSSTTEATFFGELATEYGTKPILDDDRLQVVGGEQVEFTYLDKLQATGQTDVPVKVYCETRTGYNGRLTIYGERKGEMEEKRGNFSLSPATLPSSPEEIETFKAGDTLIVILEDFDLNIDSTTIQSLASGITASENSTRDAVRISLSEISADAGIFTGELKTAYGEEAIENDGVLQVQGNGEVTFRYVDALQDTGETQVPIEKTVTVETGVRGNLELYNADASLLIGSFSAGETVLLRLNDNDLNLNREMIDNAFVTVAGSLLRDEVSITLDETETNSGIFQAPLQTQYSDSADFTDNILQVKEKELVTATYIDKIVGTGETDVPIQLKAFVLSSNPGILLITNGNYDKELGRFEEIGSFNAGETIYFWLEDLLLSTVNPNAEVTITVSGDKTNDLAEVTLEPFPDKEGAFFGSIPTRYGTTPIYDNTLDVVGDAEVTAVYQPNFPGVYTPPVTDSVYVNKGTRGHLLIVRADGTKVDNFNAGATLYFRLRDSDLNLNPYAPDSADIWVHTSAEGIGKIVTLRETSESSGIFSGSLKTEYGHITKASEVYTQRLGLLGGEIVTATYTDALIETGETNVEIRDTCRANMVGKATYTTEKIIIDGLPDKWPLENVMRTEQGEALMWAQWDSHNLYLFVQVRDTEVVVPDPTKWYRGADALELHLDLQPTEYTRPAYLSTALKPQTYILWFCPEGGGLDGREKYAGQAHPKLIYNYSPPIAMAFRPYDDYYTMEIAIPFGVVLGGFDPLKTRRKQLIGFNYIIHRSDAPPVQWARPAKPGAPIPPSELGILILQRRE